MTVIVTNRSSHLLLVELNTGETIHLAPAESSRVLDDVDIENNPWVDRMRARGDVVVERDQASGRGASKPSRKKAAKSPKTTSGPR